MNTILQTPTINEILFNRKDKHKASPYTIRPSLYHRGDIVAFKFGKLIRHGRITTEMHNNGMSSYHIESSNGTWYRGINEEDIISKEL